MCSIEKLGASKQVFENSLNWHLQATKAFTGFQVYQRMCSNPEVVATIRSFEVSQIIRELFNNRDPRFEQWASYPLRDPATLVYVRLQGEQLEEIHGVVGAAV